MAISKQQIEGQDPLVEELRDVVGDENVLSERDELLVYECDGLPQHKHLPRAVVFPNYGTKVSASLREAPALDCQAALWLSIAES